MAGAKNPKTYQQLNDELASLIDWFEGDQVNLDEASAKYEQAIELIQQMEKYLATTENKIKKISAKFDEPAV
jgi:exodeoxyribonuclease VII small subunit